MGRFSQEDREYNKESYLMGDIEKKILNDLLASALDQSPTTIDIIQSILAKDTQYSLAVMKKGSIEIFIKDKKCYKVVVHTDLKRGIEI